MFLLVPRGHATNSQPAHFNNSPQKRTERETEVAATSIPLLEEANRLLRALPPHGRGARHLHPGDGGQWPRPSLRPADLAVPADPGPPAASSGAERADGRFAVPHTSPRFGIPTHGGAFGELLTIGDTDRWGKGLAGILPSLDHRGTAATLPSAGAAFSKNLHPAPARRPTRTRAFSRAPRPEIRREFSFQL